MTASEVKYLIGLVEVKAINNYVKQNELAKYLGYSKVSVSRAVDNLLIKKMLVKNNAGNICLTDDGVEKAKKYKECTKVIVELFNNSYLNINKLTFDEAVEICCSIRESEIDKIYLNKKEA